MQQIHCLMIGKDRSVTDIRVDASKINFTHNKGLYTLPREAVNIAKFVDSDQKKKKEPYPELIYIEGNALPVNKKTGNVQEFLEHIVLSNALHQVAAPRSDFMAAIMDYVRHPSKALLALFVLIIAGTVIGGLLFP